MNTTNEPDFTKAKYLATLVLQCTSLAELYLKDYEYEMRRLGFKSRQLAKKMINDNAKDAKRLKINLAHLEGKLLNKITDDQQDDFLDDVAFLHKMLKLVVDRCGDNETKRQQAYSMIFNSFKSELNIM